ncbi:MAG TPA: folate-binding protein [Terriglobales bacterium]|nr:folate-binding protein [Terriglobales bacterium]
MSLTAQQDGLGAQPLGAARGDFGDVRGEFAVLISGCGVYDLGERAKISLTGGDRVRWLNGMVTNNVRDLAPGHGVYAFLLNPQGHILGDLYAYNLGGSLLVDTDQAQTEKILAVFDKYIIMDDVEVTDVSEKLARIGLAGPNSLATLRAAGFEVPSLAPGQFVELIWGQMNVALVRSDNRNVESFELWSPPENVEKLYAALVEAGAKPAGTAAVELLRIAAGIPRYGVDIRERDLPQETEQERALSFVKGCYVGQEIVERIRSRGQVRRKFSGFEIQGALPAPGSKIQLDGKDVGEITSAASLPLASGDRRVALGYIGREAATAGKVVNAGGSEARVAKLPFIELSKQEVAK